jgi:hypothetical protein
MSAWSLRARGVSRIVAFALQRLTAPAAYAAQEATACKTSSSAALARRKARYARYVTLLRHDVSCLASTDLYRRMSAAQKSTLACLLVSYR